jgi:drug/metabolite transporter (DMT)-like permease
VRGRLAGEALLVVVIVLWSFGFTATKYALTHGFSPLAFSAPRFLFAGLLLLLLTRRREGAVRIARRDLPLLLAAGVVGIWLNQLAFIYAVRLTTAATVALVFGTLPVLTALFAQLARAERLGPRHWVATAVSFTGVGLIAVGAGAALSGDLGGILLALAASLSFAVYSVLIGPLITRSSALRVSALVTIVGAVPLGATASGQLAGEHWGSISLLAWACFAYTLCTFTLTVVLWFGAIERVGAAHATLYSNLQPFLGAVFALLVLSEPLHGLQIAGAFVLLASIALARRRKELAARAG